MQPFLRVSLGLLRPEYVLHGLSLLDALQTAMIVRLLGSKVNLRRFLIFEFVLNMLVHWLNNCMLGARML